MFKSHKIDLKLVALIVLPLVLAAVSLTINSFSMLEKIAGSVNKQENLRSIQAARSAVYSLHTSLEGIATDNALWDEAAAKSYSPIDEKWLQDNWGVGSSDANYDTVFVVDPSGRTIFSSRNGAKTEQQAKEILGSTLGSALSAMPLDNKTFEVTSSLVKVPDGIAALAIAPILPSSAGTRLGHPKPNYLILLRTVSPDAITTLGKNFILDDLRLSALKGNDNSGETVLTTWGQPIAKLFWSNRNPGEAARDANTLSVWLNILALILVLSPIAFVHFRTLAKIDSNEKASFKSARHDALSGLANRVLLIEEVSRLLPQCHTESGEMAMAFVDLDGFKAVNDAYGHDIGDSLIKVIGKGLQVIAGDNFVVARLGGDEFAILHTGKNAFEQIEKFAEQVLALVREPFDLQGRIVGVGASIGIAQCTDPKMEISEFMRQADIAMYDAKGNGRNRWRKFNAALDVERSEELSIVGEMRRILDKDLMEVAYQPFVCSRDRTILGVEALARWPASSHRKLGPDRFVQLAEQHGLIDKLGMAILRKACRDTADWRDLKLAVNFSPLQIKRSNLVNEIKEVAAEFDFDLNRLEIEFTESVLIQNPERAKVVIVEMQALGISVALDDFGTGYASVGYLHRYAFDKIKLDRSLTQSLARGSMTQNIVQGTVLIAKGLSADVIAEGVETEEDANLMRLAGCELLQGYYFGKPQSVAVLNDLLLGHPVRQKTVSG